MTHHKFWMVYSEGGQSPKAKHDSERSAAEEAHRLAKLNGRPAYVLESISGYEVPEPLVVKFSTKESLPTPAGE